MEQASKNRLQFVHHDECFPTREAAKAYVIEGQVLERPSLYAEPMVLKYGDESNPNILLAIGSVGDGTIKLTNKTFFIDVADIEESINEIVEDVNANKDDIAAISGIVSTILESCGLNSDGTLKPFENELIADEDTFASAVNTLADYVLELEERLSFDVEDTNTIDLTLEDGKLKADSIFPLKYTFDGRCFLDNQLNEEDINGNRSGHFINVDLNYDGNGEPLQLVVNGKVTREIELPFESHVVSGEYDKSKESIILGLSDGTQVEIDVEKLAAELNVETPRTSPVELSIKRVGPTNVNGQDEYKSILSAKLHVADEEDNIAEIKDDGESDAVLYVKGTADNIKYKNGNVKNALDSLDNKVSTETNRAESAEAEIRNSMSTLSGFANSLQTELDNEMYERQAADDNMQQKINAVSGYATEISGQVHSKEYEIKNLIRETSGSLESAIEDVDKHRTVKISPIGSENLKLISDDSSGDATYLNGFVKVLDSNDNIIEGGNSIIGGALYATVKMNYSPKLNAITFETSGPRTGSTSTFYLNNADLEYDSTRNVLKYTYTVADSLSGSTMASKEFKLNSFGVVDHIDYNSELEQLEIYYKDAGGDMQRIDVPVGDLFNELVVENTNTVDLTKVRKIDGSDVLSADVNISQNDGNMLSARNDGLYVPESGVTANTAAIAELSAKTTENTTNISTISATVESHDSRIETLENNSSSAEQEISDLTERVESAEQRLDTLQGNALVEGSVANAVANALAESKEYTDEKVDAITLEGSSAITVDYTNKTISLKVNDDLNSEGYLKKSENGIYVSGIDAAIEAATSGKADAGDVYTKDESDAKFATKEEVSEIDNRLTEAESNINEISGNVETIETNISSLSDRVTETENKIETLNGNELVEGSVSYIAKEYSESVREELNDKIDSAQDEIDKSVKSVALNQHGDNELVYDLIYTLNNGISQIGGTLNIPKDKFLQSVSYDPATKKLTFVFVVESGTTTQTIDISDLVDTYYAGKTTTISSGNVIEAKVCEHEHNEYLKVCDDGLYVGGVNAAIAAATSGKADTNDVYTKNESDTKFETKDEADELEGVVDESVKSVGLNKHTDNELIYDLIYTLNNGISQTGGTLNIPKDKFLQSVSYDPSTKTLTFVFNVESGTTTETINMSDLVDTYYAGRTTTISSGNVIEVKVCNHEHNEYLKVCEDGLYVGGIDEAISTAIDGAVSGKADANSVYTKTESDERFAKVTDLNTLSATVNTHTSEIAELREKINEVSADTEHILETAKEYTDIQVEELRQEISGGSADVSALRRELIATSGILQSEIVQKADANSVYTKQEIDEMIGEIPSYSGDIAALSGQIINVSGQVVNVSGTANEALDLANEIKLKYNWIVADTNTIDLTKSESTNSGSTLTADVKISSNEGNALTANTSGLYVGLSKLTYSTAGNELTFTNANGESNVITLNSVDVVKNIYYDGETDELVFVYTAEGVEKTTRISAAAFFKGIVGTAEGNVTVTTALTPSGSSQNVATAITANLDVNDIIDNTDGNVTLSKVSNANNKIQANLDVNRIVSTGNSLTKYVQVEFRKSEDNNILGYVGISTLENNVLTKDSENELFVPKEASNYTCIYNGDVVTVQEAITDLENAGDDGNIYKSVGVTTADTAITNYMQSSNYLDEADTVIEALLALDDTLAEVSAKTSNEIEGVDTDSTDINISIESGVTQVSVDVKLSEQNITDENESPRGENILQILNDGLYFGGIIDCGSYDD